jgi:hypothetical protein
MFELLYNDIATDLRELAENGRMRRAIKLASETGQDFNTTAEPQYFVGDLASPVVIVQLNPGPTHGAVQPEPSATVGDYLDRMSRFGAEHYGPGLPKWHSRFDDKQIQFFRPFDVFEFEPDEAGEDARQRNRALVLDAKLQLELIPYGSPQFRLGRKGRDLLDQHFERLMDTIAAAPRTLVIFTGVDIAALVKPYIVAGEDHRFRVMNQHGSPMRSRSRFAHLSIPYRNRTIDAWWAPSYPRQGLPMHGYGAECAARFHAANRDGRGHGITT